ncbi:MAG: hypothetical protein K8T90_05655 [Planctomycetes bacterium]|nr:hypothetical protein [Planctomycetota bacterium]
MDHMNRIDALPAGSRVWVFAATRPLTADDETRLTEIVGRVFGVWAKKSPGAEGSFEFREGRFLVVGADERACVVSGCGIDALMQWTRQLEQESGLRLVDRMQVFWRAADGSVRSDHRTEFKRLLEAGEVSAQTHVFDTAAASSDVFRDGRFELPLASSWHAQVFPAAARA